MTPDDLRKAREESANVAYQTFIKHLREDKNGFFFFIEGKDAPYYILRIKSSLKEIYPYSIVCNGKKGVIKVNELINNHDEYLKYKIGYFVDKDFDPSIENPQIYETPTYSIENLYCYPETVSEILKNEFGLTEVDDDYKNAIKRYSQLLSEVTEAQSLFNSWYYCLKEKKRNERLNTTGVSLSAKFPKRYIIFGLSGITQQYDLDKIRNDFPNAISIDDNRIKEFMNECARFDKIAFLRGKYLLEFMHAYLDKVVTDSNQGNSFIKNRINYHIELSRTLSTFSQYAKTPDCLIRYLVNFL